MASKNKKISALIDQQLPGFISSEYGNFSKFVEKYYEQLESTGQPIDIINNITKYSDINYYEENLLKQSSILTSPLSDSGTTIVVENATSFPRENGYIKIDDEICFYKLRTDTEFLDVSRGVSGNTTLGDLYSESTFVTTKASSHNSGVEVYNISNLFLYAFIKNFEEQYLGAFPEKYLKGEVDKRTLIKNINKFYKAKGTDKSIKFIFNSIISRDPKESVELYNPKDSTIKASTSDWTTSYSLKVKILSGNPLELIGEELIQQLDEDKPKMLYASAIVDNVIFKGSTSEGEIYEIILDPSTINGKFETASKTTLRKTIPSNLARGRKINVGSTLGWKSTGKILIGTEVIKYNSKNSTQFVIDQRGNPPFAHTEGSDVYSFTTVSGKGVTLLTLGVLYNLLPKNYSPYSEVNDSVQITGPGFETRDPIIFDRSKNAVRWIINENNIAPQILSNIPSQTLLRDELANVSSIYEDDQYYYICSSGYPSHNILTEGVDEKLVGQNLLRLIRKTPITTAEVYSTGIRDVGIFVDGTIAFNHKDDKYIDFGKITKINITNSGFGYKNPPFVLINGQPRKARAILAGEFVESIIVDTKESFSSIPKIEITAGKNAVIEPVVTGGSISSLVIKNSGQYYSAPPIIRISDLASKGKFANYKAVVSPRGEITELIKIDGGKFYTKENVTIEVIENARRSEAKATAEIEKWYFDRFKKYQSKLDISYGYAFETFDSVLNSIEEYYYGRVGNPKQLRIALNDNLSSTFQEPQVKTHSPILGFAYDGVPIYGPFGYSDPTDSSSEVTKISSGYILKSSRSDGPPVGRYSLGTFIKDYEWRPSVNTGKTELDENNGRFCVTPDYPNGVYAYFLTIDSNNNPIFPYILGKNYYSLPVDSNYNSNISQSDIPVTAKRLKTSKIENNGDGVIAIINSVSKGGISGTDIQESTDNFKVGSIVRVNNTGTEGTGATASVSSVTGKNVLSLEAIQTKATEIKTLQTAYYFEEDVITQESTGASGILIGDVINDNQLVLRNVQGTFVAEEEIKSTINVINLVLSQNSSFTVGSAIILFDGLSAPVATGQALETTNNQNSIRIKVISGEFVLNNTLFLKSNNLNDTVGSKIISINSLSFDIIPNSINENIAIVETEDNHNSTIGDKIVIDVNPDDNLTETDYYIRKRYYQKISLRSPKVIKRITDTGIGSLDLMNSGVDYQIGTYTNVELIFQNSTTSRRGIGLPGNPGNARATIVVSGSNDSLYGGVTQIIFTSKGAGYRKGDILTVADSNLNRLSTSISTQRLSLLVDHVGFSNQNTQLYLNSVSGISNQDLLQIGSEIVQVISVNETLKSVAVLRGRNNTRIVNHYDDAEVSIVNSRYRFEEGQRIKGVGLNDPYVVSYDPLSQELILKFDYAASSPNQIVRSNTFYDSSFPEKLVSVSSTNNTEYRLEFSKDNINFQSNPVIQIQKYYKYRFDVSHFSMLDTYLDFSTSLNYNIFTEEKSVSDIAPGNPGSFISIKLGFGPNIATNTFEQKKPINFTNYFYFIKVSDVNTQNSFLNVVDDPLTGEKQILYATNKRFVYQLNGIPEYDGTGIIEYTTSSKFAIGKIQSVTIENFGENYSKVPTIYGVDVAQEYEATVDVIYDAVDKKIKSIAVLNEGKNYSKPKALVVDGDGKEVEFDTIVENGSIKKVTVINEGNNYTYKPTVKIIETDVKLFFASDNIGLPQTVSIIENGFGFHADKTLYYNFEAPTVLLLENFEDNSFSIGEKIIQRNNGIQIFSAVVAKNGYKNGSNILRIEKINGIIDETLPIRGVVKNKTANIKAILSTKFNADIRAYFDNQGRFSSDRGKIGVSSQKITDSFFYQDYSYVVRSKTSINTWRDLIKDTVHPAGFELFGEVLVESDGNTSMPSDIENNKTESITFIDLGTKNISVIDTKRYLTESFVSLNSLNIQRGLGSVSVDTFDAAETVAGDFILSTPFTGRLDTYDGQPIGATVFTMIDKKSGLPLVVYNEQQLIITIDGVLQEPGKAFKINGSQITFDAPPFGDSLTEGQEIKGQKFYGRHIKFKNNNLNQKYLRKLKSIENEFDGIETTFNLYYDNGDVVKTDINENLIVTLNAVVQKANTSTNGILNNKNSYYILRSTTPSIPDKIVFSDPPIKHNDIEEGSEPELSGYERFFSYSVGSYIRLKINNNLIPFRRTGPFLITDEIENRVKKIDNSKYALVFIDGVLQVEKESYNINGPTITFTKPLNYFISENDEVTYPDVNIILLYGRDLAQSLTAYDFERDAFYNKLTLNIVGENTYNQFINWYGPVGSKEIVVYQNNTILGKLRRFAKNSVNSWSVVLSAQNVKYNSTLPLKFSALDTYTDYPDLTITGSYQVFSSYGTDEDGNRSLIRSSNRHLYGSELADKAWYEQTRSYANLQPGDLIKIDGENNYREIVQIPNTAKTKDYRTNSFISNDIYSKITATNYNDIVRGEGLSIVAKISNGKVVSLDWNRRELNLYFENNLLLQPTAYQYFTPPVIQFIPNDGTGGGASAEVIVYDGQVIDLVLLDGGSEYQQVPTVVVARRYDVIRDPNRKIDSLTLLGLNPYIKLTLRVSGIQPPAIFASSALVAIEDIKRVIISIVTPVPKILGTSQTKFDTQITIALPILLISPQPINTYREITSIIDAKANIISSSAIQSISREITKTINKIVNNSIIEVPNEATNDIGAFLDIPLSETDTIVYIADTSRFPSASRLLIGKEIVTYGKKLTDRFLDVIRGTFGTTATTHEAGDYLRHLPELISIVPVGPTTSIITEIKITEVYKTDSAIVRVISTSSDDVIDVTVIEDTTELTVQQQIEVDNSDIQLIYLIAIIPPTSYATSLNSYSSTQITTNVGNSIIVYDAEIELINEITNICFSIDSAAVNSYSSTQIVTNVGNNLEIISLSPDTQHKVETTLTTTINAITNLYDAEIESINEITIISAQVNSAAVNSSSSIQITTNVGNSINVTVIEETIELTGQTEIEVDNSDIESINEITIISAQIDSIALNSYSSRQLVSNVGDNLEFIYSSVVIQNKVETTLTTTINIITFVQNKLTTNSRTLTEDAEIISFKIVETGIVDYFEQSEDVKFVNKYNLGNAGFNLKTFENNAFVDTGSFDINGTLESIDSAYPLLTIENFEIRPNSSITLTGDIFNLGIPTINSVGTFITSNVIPSQTTILVQSTERFSANGKLLIGKEIVSYNGKTQNSFTGLIRGFDNTIAGTHTSGDYLRTFD